MLLSFATSVIVRDIRRGDRLTPIVLSAGLPFVLFSKYLAMRGMSLSSERLHARAICLLIDFISARRSEYADVSRRRELFNDLAHCLATGTIRDARDASGLWWLPRGGTNVGKLLNAICTFSDWVTTITPAMDLNPKRTAFVAEEIAYWRRWNKYRYRDLLAHTSDPLKAAKRARIASTFAMPVPHASYIADPPFFPLERFDQLLTVGFANKRAKNPTMWEAHCLRDILVALLLHAGGIRVSEAFHLWVNDVYTDPIDSSSSYVRVFHPSDGLIESADPLTGHLVRRTRAAYLLEKFNRRPLSVESAYNGWKGNALSRNGNFMPIFWFPQFYGKIFLNLFKLYITFIRPMSLQHPWLFVTNSGEPMTAKAYRKRHDAAVQRIGLTVAKSLGTTPHGHRHAFGQRLQGAVDREILDPKMVQVLMHHRSVTSQGIYSEPSFGKIRKALGSIDADSTNGDSLRRWLA